MPNNATNEPNRVADIVRGGGLKPDKLKKRELLSLLKAVAWIEGFGMDSPIYLSKFGGFILPVKPSQTAWWPQLYGLGGVLKQVLSNRVDFIRVLLDSPTGQLACPPVRPW